MLIPAQIKLKQYLPGSLLGAFIKFLIEATHWYSSLDLFHQVLLSTNYSCQQPLKNHSSYEISLNLQNLFNTSKLINNNLRLFIGVSTNTCLCAISHKLIDVKAIRYYVKAIRYYIRHASKNKYAKSKDE